MGNVLWSRTYKRARNKLNKKILLFTFPLSSVLCTNFPSLILLCYSGLFPIITVLPAKHTCSPHSKSYGICHFSSRNDSPRNSLPLILVVTIRFFELFPLSVNLGAMGPLAIIWDSLDRRSDHCKVSGVNRTKSIDIVKWPSAGLEPVTPLLERSETVRVHRKNGYYYRHFF
jgi:hypothetical protein